MKKFIQNKLKEQKGLTLIELLAVIVILAIIAAIAIPAIGGIIDNSRVGAVKSDAINILNAAKMYSAETSAKSSVTLKELEDLGFIDDAGSFEGANKTGPDAVTVNTVNNTLTGANKDLNGVILTFDGADLKAINSVPNGSEKGTTDVATEGLGTVIITSR